MSRRKPAPAGKPVALVGNPNVGKSTVFNGLTGLNQHTGNWPGKTVALAQGRLAIAGETYRLVDLPGTYTLAGSAGEERVTLEFIASGEADCVVIVCDATALERNLILAQQVMQRQDKAVLCLNLMDEAERGNIHIDRAGLEKALGIPVVATAAGSGKGLDRLKAAIARACRQPGRPNRLPLTATTAQYIAWAEEVTEKTVLRGRSAYHLRQLRLDRLLTGKGLGIPLLLLLLLAVIWLTISGANYPSQVLKWGFDWVQARLAAWLSGLPWYVTGPLLDGVYATVARVIAVMLPPMAIFFPLFTLLEDVGYLPRVAFVLDRGLSRCGACGKQALTMCMGLGCNAVGVTGCRIIDSPRERLIAVVTNGFLPCNGRFPTLILLGSIFFGGGGFLGALTVTALIALGTGAAMAASWLLSRTILRGQPSAFVLELPPFRKPRVGQILVRSLTDRTLLVARRAALVAAPAGLLTWCLGAATWNGRSLLAWGAALLEPVGRALGMDGAIALSFLLALPANELFLPVLTMLLTGGVGLGPELEQTGPLLLGAGWSWPTAMCVMIFVVLHWPCGTTLATIVRETGKRRWAVLAAVLPTAIGAGICLLITALLR